MGNRNYKILLTSSIGNSINFHREEIRLQSMLLRTIQIAWQENQLNITIESSNDMKEVHTSFNLNTHY